MGVFRRQDYDYDDPWYSETAFIVKWVIVGVIFLAFVVFIVGGYIHAQRRMKKGNPPLRYHRWMVSRAQRERFAPPRQPQNNFSFYRQDNGYGQSYPMQPWVAPPPAYADQGYVPPYPGASEGSKVNPNQTYAPPQGPPPPSRTAQPGTSSSRPVNDPPAQESGRVYT